MLRAGSRTFFAASLLLPRHVREPASVLYAFCRQADDAVDHPGAHADAVPRLRARLDLAYGGAQLAQPADRALAAVARRHAIPRALPAALLEGLEWDCAGREYEDLPQLYDYAARVAGAVGAMMALLMGARSAAAVARACDLGVAMQLSNIARDVGEDARAGRLYLPRRWLRDAGIDPQAWLADPVFSPALGSVVRRLLARADELYARVDAGVASLPLACRPGINAARFLYAEIGREVARAGYDSVSRRAVVPAARKAALIAAAALAAPVRVRREAVPPLPECAFLVDAATTGAGLLPDLVAVPARPPRWWNVSRKLVRMIELIERLERRDQLRRLGSES